MRGTLPWCAANSRGDHDSCREKVRKKWKIILEFVLRKRVSKNAINNVCVCCALSALFQCKSVRVFIFCAQIWPRPRSWRWHLSRATSEPRSVSRSSPHSTASHPSPPPSVSVSFSLPHSLTFLLLSLSLLLSRERRVGSIVGLAKKKRTDLDGFYILIIYLIKHFFLFVIF